MVALSDWTSSSMRRRSSSSWVRLSTCRSSSPRRVSCSAHRRLSCSLSRSWRELSQKADYRNIKPKGAKDIQNFDFVHERSINIFKGPILCVSSLLVNSAEMLAPLFRRCALKVLEINALWHHTGHWYLSQISLITPPARRSSSLWDHLVGTLFVHCFKHVEGTKMHPSYKQNKNAEETTGETRLFQSNY